MANIRRKDTFRVYCETAEEWEALQELTRNLGFQIPTGLMPNLTQGFVFWMVLCSCSMSRSTL